MTAPVTTTERGEEGEGEETRRRKQAQVWFARGDTNPFGEPPLTLTKTRKPTPTYTKTRTRSQNGVSCLFRLPAPRFEKTRPKVRVFPFAIVYVLICAFSLLNHQDSRKPAPRFEKTRPKVRETPPQGASFPFRTQIRQN